jgi:hypothetical protein
MTVMGWILCQQAPMKSPPHVVCVQSTKHRQPSRQIPLRTKGHSTPESDPANELNAILHEMTHPHLHCQLQTPHALRISRGALHVNGYRFPQSWMLWCGRSQALDLIIWSFELWSTFALISQPGSLLHRRACRCPVSPRFTGAPRHHRVVRHCGDELFRGRASSCAHRSAQRCSQIFRVVDWSSDVFTG